MAWLYAGLGGAGMLLCCCSVVNIILVCAQCYHRQNSEWGNITQSVISVGLNAITQSNCTALRSHRESILDLNYTSSLPLRLRTHLS